MSCEDIMEKNVTGVSEGDTVLEAARKMKDLDVGFLPVCDPAGKPLGTLTDRDIAIRVASEDKQPSGTRVKDVMTHEVIACRTTDDLSKAEELMSRHQKSRMMVTDDAGKVVGVISMQDLARKAGGHAAGETMEHVKQ